MGTRRIPDARPAECAGSVEGGGGKPPGFSEEFGGGFRRMFSEASLGRRQGAADSIATRIPPTSLGGLEAWRLGGFDFLFLEKTGKDKKAKG